MIIYTDDNKSNFLNFQISEMEWFKTCFDWSEGKNDYTNTNPGGLYT